MVCYSIGMSNEKQDTRTEPTKANHGRAFISPMSGDETEIAVEVDKGKFPEMMVIPTAMLEDLYLALREALGK